MDQTEWILTQDLISYNEGGEKAHTFCQAEMLRSLVNIFLLKAMRKSAWEY